jgi:hypothetical protein
MLKVAMLATALLLGATGLATAATSTSSDGVGHNPQYPFQTNSLESNNSSTSIYPFSSNTQSCSFQRLNHNPANQDGDQHFRCHRG